MMNNFHFLRPAWFMLLPLLVWLLWLYSRRQAASRSWQAACDPALLPHLLIGDSERPKSRSGSFFTAICGGLVLVALAGPAWKQLEQPVFRDQSALVLVLDLSRSMNATDITPSRLIRARHKVIDILKRRREGQTALVIYAADAFVVSPLTQDAATIISQVSALDTTLLPRQGSRLDLALKKSAQLLKQSGSPKGQLLMITDGLENVPKEGITTSLALLKEQGVRVSVLGVGSTEGAPIKLAQGGFLRDKKEAIVISKLDESALIKMSKQGGGSYHRLSLDDRDIRPFFEAPTAGKFEEQEEQATLKADRWREEGPWLLLLLLPFAALAFRRGHLASLVFIFASTLALTLLSFPYQAAAFDWQGLWSRQDQQAARVFSQGEEEAAAKLFVDPEWKAAAHYRAGEYQKSIESLEGIQTPDALYNKGNALAQMGRLPEAVQSYDEALKLDPKHEDAGYNRKKLLEKMNQQNQNEKNKSQGDPSDNKKEDPQNQSGENQSGDDQAGEQARDSQEGQDSSAHNQGHEETRKEDEQKEDREGKPIEEAGNKDDSEKDRETEHAEQQDESGEEGASSLAKEESSEENESQQAIAQWLRRIPDDPGGLLRRKFLYQSQQQTRTGPEDKTW
ncbi:MAG: VWA domain-containing protein [Nitrospiria bacterium]